MKLDTVKGYKGRPEEVSHKNTLGKSFRILSHILESFLRFLPYRIQTGSRTSPRLLRNFYFVRIQCLITYVYVSYIALNIKALVDTIDQLHANSPYYQMITNRLDTFGNWRVELAINANCNHRIRIVFIYAFFIIHICIFTTIERILSSHNDAKQCVFTRTVDVDTICIFLIAIYARLHQCVTKLYFFLL